MRLDRIAVVAKREYAARIRSKGFWISTVALPLLFLAMSIIPSLLVSRTTSARTVVIVDETGQLGAPLLEALTGANRPGQTEFEVLLEAPAVDTVTQRSQLDQRVLDKGIDSWLWITTDDLERGEVEYHSESVASFISQSLLENRITDVVRRARLSEFDIAPEAADGLLASIDLKTVRVSAEGSKEEGARAGFFLAYALFFLLYLMLLIYGQQVMTGVLEEKTSRIVEVMISTTQPFQLMMGKLLGVCGIALTQLAIWLTSIGVVTLPGIAASIAWLPDGVDIPRLMPSVIVHFFLLFLIGFFVYATFYAAIGAAFNNVQEAQQFAGFAVIFLVAPMFFFILVINDPDSTLSVVTSLIPPFTPTIMLLRLAVKAPPFWQVALGYILTIGFALFMVSVAGRIYRIGILMYGKKPTVQELWRWLRYR